MLNDRKPPKTTPKRAPDTKRRQADTRVDPSPEARPEKKRPPVGVLVGAAASGLLLLGLVVAVLGGDDEAKTVASVTSGATATTSPAPEALLAPAGPKSAGTVNVKKPWGAAAAGLPTPELQGGAGPPDLDAIHGESEGEPGAHDHDGEAGHEGQSCGGGPESGAADGATALAALEEGLRNDPAALRGALDHFRAARKREDVELLASVLGRVPDPAVLSAAVEVAGRDAEPWRRAAAFDLLDGLDTPAALPVALKALQTEQDVEARRAAVHALPMPTGVPAREARAVTTALVRAASSDADPEVRRRSAVALGDWARTPEDLAPVVAGLSGDPSIDVRAGCAFALEIARSTDPASRAALVAAVSRRDEDPLVRDNAWRALGAAGPLGDKEHTAWAAYRDERGAAQK